MTVWGAPKRLGPLRYFVTAAQNSPPSHVQATLGQADTGRPGVAEALLESVVLRVRDGGTVRVTYEFPDLETFTRAAVAAGPSFPVLERVGEQAFKQALVTAFADAVTPGLGLRITSEVGWLAAGP